MKGKGSKWYGVTFLFARVLQTKENTKHKDKVPLIASLCLLASLHKWKREACILGLVSAIDLDRQYQLHLHLHLQPVSHCPSRISKRVTSHLRQTPLQLLLQHFARVSSIVNLSFIPIAFPSCGIEKYSFLQEQLQWLFYVKPQEFRSSGDSPFSPSEHISVLVPCRSPSAFSLLFLHQGTLPQG